MERKCKRWAKFIGFAMRREKLKHLVATGISETRFWIEVQSGSVSSLER